MPILHYGAVPNVAYLSQALNNSGAWFDIVFKAPASGALNSLRCKLIGLTGSPSLSDIVVSLYNVDSKRLPSGTALATGSFGSLSYGLQTCTFGSPASVSNGSFYCVRITNANASPSSNYVTPYVAGAVSDTPFATFVRAYSGSGTAFSQTLHLANEVSLNIGGTVYERPFGNYYNSAGYSYAYDVYATASAKRFIGSQFVTNSRSFVAGGICGVSAQGATLSRSDMRLYLLDGSNNILASAPFTIKSGTWGDYHYVFFDSPVDASAGTYRLVMCGDEAFGTAWNSGTPVRTMQAGDRNSPTNQYTTVLRTGFGIYGESSSSSLPSWTTVSSMAFYPAPILDIQSSSGGGLLVNPGLNGGLIQI